MLEICRFYAGKELPIRKLLLAKAYLLNNLLSGMLEQDSDEERIDCLEDRTCALGVLLGLTYNTAKEIMAKSEIAFTSGTYMYHFEKDLDKLY